MDDAIREFRAHYPNAYLKKLPRLGMFEVIVDGKSVAASGDEAAAWTAALDWMKAQIANKRGI